MTTSNEKATVAVTRPAAGDSAFRVKSSTARQRIAGVTLRQFLALRAQIQDQLLSHWRSEAEQLREAGTLPVRLRGRALLARLDLWAQLAEGGTS